MGSMKDLFGDEPYQMKPRHIAPPDTLPGEIDIADIPQEVRILFEELALKLKSQGFGHYSSDAILHRIRWHMHVERGRRDFKCNNNWTSRLARWLLSRHPEMDGFFELRRSPGA